MSRAKQHTLGKWAVWQHRAMKGEPVIGKGAEGFLVTLSGWPTLCTASGTMKSVCGAAQITDERTTPKGRRKLYLSTRAAFEGNIALLVEQTIGRQLEQKQFSVGREE